MLRKATPASVLAAMRTCRALGWAGATADCSPCSTSYSTRPGQLPQVNPSRHPPWTPTRLLDKRKVYPKRMRHLIEVLEHEQLVKAVQDKHIDPFRAGDVLEVKVVVPEAERRVYTYRGVCIARANKSLRTWFKIYNVFPDTGGFVQHFPLYMPDLVSVRVVGRVPGTRRARMYHLLQQETERHTYQAYVEPPHK